MTAQPLATCDQLQIEARALDLQERPDVRAACSRVADHWLRAMRPNPEHRARFASEFEQAAFCGIMNAINADPSRPRIHAFGRYAHDLDGRQVPATKSGHPNPDYVYRFMPLDGSARYVLRGRFAGEAPVAIEIGMLTAGQVYQQNLSKRDLVLDADGGFTITIDSRPANGRANHFRSTPESRQLLIRDVLGDLTRQRPIVLEVETASTGLLPLPDDDASIAATCEDHMRKHVDDLVVVYRELLMKNAANHFEAPAVHTEGGYGVSQAYCPVNFRLPDDQAFVLTLELGNASYAVVPVSDFWGGLGPVLDRQVTLGTGRAIPDPDGRFTFVVAHADPGVHNWVDPAGLHEGGLFLRWVGFDPGDRRLPSITARQIPFDRVDDALPLGCPRLPPEERGAQLAQRRSDYLSVMG